MAAATDSNIQDKTWELLRSGNVDDLRVWIRNHQWNQGRWIDHIGFLSYQHKHHNLLHFACRSGNLPIVRMLCEEFSANVNCRDDDPNEGLTPLMHAVYYNRVDVIVYLCERRYADVHVKARGKRYQNQTAAEFALARGHSEAAQYIHEREENVYILFSERLRMQEIEAELRQLEPRTKAFTLNSRFCSQCEEKMPRIHELFDEMKYIVEVDKQKLMSNERYWQSLLRIKSEHRFRQFEAMKMMYRAVLHALTAQPDWDKHVNELNEISRAYNYSQPQEIRSISQIYPACVVTQNKVNQLVRRLAKATNSVEGLYLSGTKSLYRGFLKAAFHIDRTYEADLWDWARAIISFPTLGELLTALLLFIDPEQFPEIRVVNVSVSFQSTRCDRNAQDSGWEDVKVHFVFHNDFPKIICELQLCLVDLTKAKINLGGHAAYSKYRSIEETEKFIRNGKCINDRKMDLD